MGLADCASRADAFPRLETLGLADGLPCVAARSDHAMFQEAGKLRALFARFGTRSVGLGDGSVGVATLETGRFIVLSAFGIIPSRGSTYGER